MGWEALGAIAELVAALAAVGALIAAVIAAVHTKQLFQIEARRDAVAADARQKEQARGVAAWAAAHIDGEGALRSFGVVVRNGSENVIYDVSVEAKGAKGASRAAITLKMLPPGTYYLAESSSAYGWEFAASVDTFDGEIRPVTKAEGRAVGEVAFRDSTNVTWRREGTGMLERVDH